MVKGRQAGYVWGVVAAALYGLNPLFTLPLYAEGMDTCSVLFFRYAVSVVFLLGLMKIRHLSFRLNAAETKWLGGLGLLMVASSYFLYLSYNEMDAGLASTILFVYPILTAVLMAVFCHERVHWLVWVCLAMATMGVLTLYETGGSVKITFLGTMFVIASAVSYAFYLVFVNRGAVGGMSTMKLTFYVLLFGSLSLLACMMMDEHASVPHGWQWGYVLGAAMMPTVMSLVFTAIAIRRIGSTETAILGAMEPITAIVIGVTVFHEYLSLRSIVGIMIIVVAVTMVVARSKLTRFFALHRLPER